MYQFGDIAGASNEQFHDKPWQTSALATIKAKNPFLEIP
jgi:hypothetical protein